MSLEDQLIKNTEALNRLTAAIEAAGLSTAGLPAYTTALVSKESATVADTLDQAVQTAEVVELPKVEPKKRGPKPKAATVEAPLNTFDQLAEAITKLAEADIKLAQGIVDHFGVQKISQLHKDQYQKALDLTNSSLASLQGTASFV